MPVIIYEIPLKIRLTEYSDKKTDPHAARKFIYTIINQVFYFYFRIPDAGDK